MELSPEIFEDLYCNSGQLPITLAFHEHFFFNFSHDLLPCTTLIGQSEG